MTPGYLGKANPEFHPVLGKAIAANRDGLRRGQRRSEGIVLDKSGRLGRGHDEFAFVESCELRDGKKTSSRRRLVLLTKSEAQLGRFEIAAIAEGLYILVSLSLVLLRLIREAPGPRRAWRPGPRAGGGGAAGAVDAAGEYD